MNEQINEQIRELLEQAGFVGHTQSLSGKEISKFTESIVQEYIEKHFGSEE